MSPESSNPARLLLFGKEPELLETRAKVLRSAGMIADIAVDLDDFEVRITTCDSIYDLVVCCHTVTEAECTEVIAISNRTRTTFTMVERLLPPRVLIDQVTNLIRRARGSMA
jgi:hypothetical protein